MTMNWRIVLITFLVTSTAYSQDIPSPDPPVQTIPPGDDVITPVRKGEPAPYTGQLFDSDTALRWANWLQQYKYRLTWDVRRAQEVSSIELKYRDDLLKAEEVRAEKVETDLRGRLERSEQARLDAEEELRNPPWYSSPVFGAVIGVIATAAVFGIAVAAIDATSP
jgi:hypothetical protein